MSRMRGRCGRCVTGFPRVSGDEPKTYCSQVCRDQFSPRERG